MVELWFVQKETRRNGIKGSVPAVIPALLLLRPVKRAGLGSHLPLRSNSKGKLMQTQLKDRASFLPKQAELSSFGHMALELDSEGWRSKGIVGFSSAVKGSHVCGREVPSCSPEEAMV